MLMLWKSKQSFRNGDLVVGHHGMASFKKNGACFVIKLNNSSHVQYRSFSTLFCPFVLFLFPPSFMLLLFFFNPYQKNKPSPPISLTPPKKKNLRNTSGLFFSPEKKTKFKKNARKI